MLEIFAVVFVIKRVISIAKEKDIKPTRWAILTGVIYGFTVLAVSFGIGILIGLGVINENWAEFPESIISSIIAVAFGFAATLIPISILKSKGKKTEESSVDLLDD